VPWEARELKAVYNPLLLFVGEKAVGVVRVDVRQETKEAIFRRVAIRTEEQRRGYGTVLMGLAEDFAAEHGCVRFVAYVAPDAMPFYTRLGYRLDPGSLEHDVPNPRMVKEREEGAKWSD
jgi:GNAT superfamily N-acetyltransferase